MENLGIYTLMIIPIKMMFDEYFYHYMLHRADIYYQIHHYFISIPNSACGFCGANALWNPFRFPSLHHLILDDLVEGHCGFQLDHLLVPRKNKEIILIIIITMNIFD